MAQLAISTNSAYQSRFSSFIVAISSFILIAISLVIAPALQSFLASILLSFSIAIILDNNSDDPKSNNNIEIVYSHIFFSN